LKGTLREYYEVFSGLRETAARLLRGRRTVHIDELLALNDAGMSFGIALKRAGLQITIDAIPFTMLSSREMLVKWLWTRQG
jgi:hypothetical protein